MPRPHYNVRAGAMRPQSDSPSAGATYGECAACAEKNAEIDRLRTELAQARAGGPGVRGGGGVMWAALAICAACIVFALTAMLRHG